MLNTGIGLPKYGPHGVLVSGPRGVTRDRLLGLSARKVAELQAGLNTEAGKVAVNAERASGRGKAAR